MSVIREKRGKGLKLQVVLTGTRAEVVALDSSDAELTEIPAKARKENSALFKEMQSAAREVNAELRTFRERLERSWLTGNQVRAQHFREFHLEHPVASRFASNLVWTDQKGRAFLGRKQQVPNDVESLALWHPAREPVREIARWRKLMLDQEILQPFRQAFRETYVVTPAEMGTRTYSNRFAGQILAARRFNGLRAQRGWSGSTLMAFEGNESPEVHLEVEKGRLRASLWFEWRGEEAEEEVMASTICLDQLRFEQRTGRRWEEALPLEDINPVVFSEVMRDVDLFVSVCGIERDPMWQDRGPGSRDSAEPFAEYEPKYWEGRAQVRHDLLSSLTKRAGLKGVKFDARHVIVTGKRAEYRIHLASGAVFMEPGARHLCIVPTDNSAGQLFLPFEDGDAKATEIFAKILLLLRDDLITDKRILNQML